MSNLLSKSLEEAIMQGQYLPIIGWGYPDLIPSFIEINKSKWDRQNIENKTSQWLDTSTIHLSPLYQAVSLLPVRYLISFTPDPFLEITLKYYDSNLIALQPNQADYPPDHRILIPLGGSSNNPETMILSESDYLNLPHKKEIFWKFAESYATRTCLLYTSPSPRDLSTSRMPSSA